MGGATVVPPDGALHLILATHCVIIDQWARLHKSLGGEVSPACHAGTKNGGEKGFRLSLEFAQCASREVGHGWVNDVGYGGCKDHAIGEVPAVSGIHIEIDAYSAGDVIVFRIEFCFDFDTGGSG